MSERRLNVEILKITSQISDQQIVDLTKKFVQHLPQIKCDYVYRDLPEEFHHHVESIVFSGSTVMPIQLESLKFFIYRASNAGPELEMLDPFSEGDEEEITASNHWILPSTEFHGLWESLIYEDGIKDNLLSFINTTILFSKRNIDHNIISCNRLVLLHGPPGTGKTSLCKALAQKLSIRLRNNYQFFHLFEINSHSLFSKWFSESGKLVMKLFTNIRNIIETKSTLVCVLIDEVESIAYARDSVSNNEPSDSLRVVNAVLTQLDQIRKFPNVLILTTSNLTSTIDLAFIDRADIKQFIGNPSMEAIRSIYQSAIDELIRVQIIDPNYDALECETLLNEVAHKSCGLSGRALRKIPFLAHSLYLDCDSTTSLKGYLIAMLYAVEKHLSDNKSIIRSIENGK